MKTYIIFLKPLSNFVGAITSDTLFGAFCWAIRDLYGVGELKEQLSAFTDSPPFVLSSPFLYVRKGDHIVRFFPKPRLPEITPQVNGGGEQELELKEKIARIENTERAKRMESAKFVSEILFREIVQGQLDRKTILSHAVDQGTPDTDIETRFNNILITTGERKKIIDPVDPEFKGFWGYSDRQHNLIDRITWGTAEGRLFFLTEEIFLNRKKQNGENVFAGLWFYLRTAEDKFVQPLLRYLQDTGLGSERTKGKGHFTFEVKEESSFPEGNENRNAFISLSRFIPARQEIDFSKKPLAYSLYVIRPKNESRLSGKDHRTLKGIIRGFEPGSVFPLPTKQALYLGHLVQMGKNANEFGWVVWHNGITLPVYAEVKE